MKGCSIALAIAGLVTVWLSSTHALRYVAYTYTGNFYDVLHACATKGGYLVAIETPAQNAKVVEAIKKVGGTGNFWTSGTDFGLEGAWVWQSRNRAVGAISGYNNFEPGRPLYAPDALEDCLAISPNGVWRDVDCKITLPFVCEFSN